MATGHKEDKEQKELNYVALDHTVTAPMGHVHLTSKCFGLYSHGLTI